MKNEGLIELFKDLIGHLFASLLVSYKRYVILRRSVLESIPEIDIQKDISIKVAGHFDLPKFAKIVSPNVLKKFAKLFDEGKICLIALDADEIIYYSWVSFEQKSFVRIEEKEAYFFDAFTMPKYRRMGIHTRMTAERLKLIRQKGYESALVMVSTKNYPALKALKKVGFEESGEASELNIPLLKLNSTYVVRREKGQIIARDSSFVCNHKRLNSYLLILQEIIISCFEKGFENFYNKWKIVPEREFIYLSENCDLNTIDKVIIIGAGAIPYTAIFFAKQLNKPVYVIEKNPLASLACSNLLHKLNLKAVKVIKVSGQHYHDYANSLVIISLHASPKEKILEKVFNCHNHNIVVIRQPLSSSSHLYDRISLNGLRYACVKHNLDFVSLIITTNIRARIYRPIQTLVKSILL